MDLVEGERGVGAWGWMVLLPGVQRGPVVLFTWVGDMGGGAGGFEKSDTTFHQLIPATHSRVFETISIHGISRTFVTFLHISLRFALAATVSIQEYVPPCWPFMLQVPNQLQR